jgi:hypothetical protein
VKLLNYMRFERSQTAVFALFIPIWTCVRAQTVPGRQT